MGGYMVLILPKTAKQTSSEYGTDSQEWNLTKHRSGNIEFVPNCPEFTNRTIAARR
jgi:hypothetical protein